MKIHLAQWRRIRKLTQKQLAVAVGVSKNTISSLEIGSFLPRLNTALKISEVLHVPISELWEFEIYDFFIGGF